MIRSRKIDYKTVNFEKLKISELKRIADYEARQYLLRKADRKFNKIYCPLKKRYYSENKINVAHFIDRATMCTRYDLDNIHLISEQSNCWDSQIDKEGYKSLHHYEYEMWLKDHIGEKNFKNLLNKSKEICIFARVDFIKIINFFRNG